MAGVAGAAAISAGLPANAALLLTYNGGATTVLDNGVGDIDPAVDSIVNSTTIGGFGVAITVASSNSPGTSTVGLLQVQSLDIRSIGTGIATLVIGVSDTDFANPGTGGTLMSLASSYGTTLSLGAIGDSTVFQSSADPANGQPASAVSTLSLTATKATNAITESYNGANATTFTRLASTYSLANTISVTLSPGGQANISGTTAATVVPEPATLASLAAVGAALAGRRRRHA